MRMTRRLSRHTPDVPKAPQAVLPREAEITRTVRDMGGTVRVGERGVSQKGNVTEVILAGTGIRDEDLSLLKELPSLSRLSLARTRITSAGLQHLRGLRQLRTLNLYKTTDSKSIDALREAMPWCTITD